MIEIPPIDDSATVVARSAESSERPVTDEPRPVTDDPRPVTDSPRLVTDEPRPVILLLHGYGADEHDLLPLSEHLPGGVDCVAVRAPLTPPFPMPGYSWFPIEGLDGRDPAAVTASAGRLLEWIDASVRAPTIGLLGFSQGGAIAIQSLRLRPEAFAFAVNLSGYAAPGALPRDHELAEAMPPVFWGRGARDEVIPAALIAHTAEWLPQHADLSGRVYEQLAHAISLDELADVRRFVDRQLADRTESRDR